MKIDGNSVIFEHIAAVSASAIGDNSPIVATVSSDPLKVGMSDLEQKGRDAIAKFNQAFA